MRTTCWRTLDPDDVPISSIPSRTPPLTASKPPGPPALPGQRPGALRVRDHNRCDAGPAWKQRTYRVLDRFVPTVPFRYLPPRQSVRLAFNVVLDREPDPAGGADYVQKLVDGELSRHGVAEALAHSGTPPAALAHRRRAALHARQPQRVVAGLPPAAASWTSAGRTRACPTERWCTSVPVPLRALVVVDLPVEERDTLYQEGSTGEPVLSSSDRWSSPSIPWSTSGVRRRVVRFVYSGQSIEHVSEATGTSSRGRRSGSWPRRLVLPRHAERPGVAAALEAPMTMTTRSSTAPRSSWASWKGRLRVVTECKGLNLMRRGAARPGSSTRRRPAPHRVCSLPRRTACCCGGGAASPGRERTPYGVVVAMMVLGTSSTQVWPGCIGMATPKSLTTGWASRGWSGATCPGWRSRCGRRRPLRWR